MLRIVRSKRRKGAKRASLSTGHQSDAMKASAATTPSERAKWTDVFAALVSVGALGVAVGSCVISGRQADLAEQQGNLAAAQNEISRNTLIFAREESRANNAQSIASTQLAARAARAAEKQARVLAGSLDANRSMVALNRELILAERAGDVVIQGEKLWHYGEVGQQPFFDFTIKNTGGSTIKRAKVLFTVGFTRSTSLREAARTYGGYLYQTIPRGGERAQRYLARPTMPADIAWLSSGYEVMYANVAVIWRDPGASEDEIRRACFMWFGPPKQMKKAICFADDDQAGP